MTPTKPDYSKVPPMAYKCTIDKGNIIHLLKKMKVPRLPHFVNEYDFVCWYNGSMGFYFDVKDELKNIIVESMSEFLAPFEKIWKESNENATLEIKPEHLKGGITLIMPSDEEIYEKGYCESYAEDQESFDMGAKWMREQIIKLNS